MKILLGLLVFAGVALAQNPSVQVQNTNTAPSGSCSGSRITYLTPNGTVYTCQSGTWAALAGGGGGTGTVTSVTVAGTTNQITATGTCTGTTTITCTLSIPSGFVLPGTIDGLTITTTTGTLTVANGKTLTVSKTLRLDGTDGTVLTFPATSATIARTDAAQTFTGTQTFSSTIGGSINGNAATATSLAADPVDCSSGQYANAIAANGDLTCAQVAYSQISGTPTAGATTALDNLASVNINTSLLAQTGVDAGSTAKPFRDLFLFGSGTYGTTYHRITGTPTSTRVWTMPDSTDTFVGLAATQTLTNKTLTTPAITTSATLTNDSLGTSPTGGHLIQNTTAAAVGAQQTSPPLFFCGNGWKTTSTAASQGTCWRISNLPVQGTTNPAGLLSFAANVNGGSYTNYFTLQGDGVNAGIASFLATTSLTVPGAVNGNSGGAYQFSAGGWTALTGLNSTTGGVDLGQGHGVYWASANTNQAASGDTSFCREGAGLVQVSAGTCNTTTAANYRDLKGRHLLAAGTAPTITAGFGTSPAIAGADESILVTVGSGGIATTGTVTFGTAYGNAPNCIASDNSSLVQTRATATTTTVALSSGATPWTAGDTISILCRGYL